MIATKSFDDAVYKIVPIEPADIQIAGLCRGYVNGFLMASESTTGDGFKQGYADMLAAVPDDLPGVTTHSGEPSAFMVPFRYSSEDEIAYALDHANDGKEYLLDRCKDCGMEWMGEIVDLFTHPAPDAITIIKAALESAAVICDNRDIASWCAQAIRAIDPQSIIKGMKP